MRNLLLPLLVVSLLIPGVSAQAATGQPWVLYDNFNTNFIDSGKWLGKEYDNDDGLMADVVREIKSNRLHLMMAAYGISSTDTGVHYPSNRVVFRNAEGITAIQATIQIGKFEVQGCSSNTDFLNAVRAQITVPLFNVNAAGPQEDSWLGDVRAQIRIQSRADLPEKLKVEAYVLRCDDAICADSPALFYKELRTVNKDQSVTYSVTWDKTTKEIKFTAGKANGKVVSDKYNYRGKYGGDYPLASKAASKTLRVDGVLANCTDEPWPRVNMEAWFENVYIKTSSD
jgi:hypothetical protein